MLAKAAASMTRYDLNDEVIEEGARVTKHAQTDPGNSGIPAAAILRRRG